MARSSGPAAAPRLTVECLEDRTVPAFLPRTGPTPALVNGSLFPPTGVGGLSIATGDVVPDAFNFDEYVLGTGPGTPGLVTVYDLFGNLQRAFLPFGGYSGGINVAVGDVTGDTRPEIIVSMAGVGAPVVGVFTPEGIPLSRFLAFPANYTGGVNIAVGNVIPDVGQTLATGAPGQPGAKDEIIVGAATAPVVQVFNAAGTVGGSFPVLGGGVFATGANVAAANVDNFRSTPNLTLPDTNAYAEIIVGAASALPLVQVFQMAKTATSAPILVEQYLAFDVSNPANLVGVTVAAGSTDTDTTGPNGGDGTRGAEVYVALTNGSRVRGFTGDSALLFADIQAFPPDYSRVVNMVVGNPFGIFNQGASDLAIVAGDGPFQQQPRLFFGFPNSRSGLNGP